MSDGLKRRLKIAWFTPLTSRIGEFSCHVVAALAELADVEIWTSDGPPYHATDAEIVVYSNDSGLLARLDSFDAVVYNMGDDLPFHGAMYGVSQRYPGVVVLHDRVLHHLFAGMWLNEPANDRETYVERMGTYYGADGERRLQARLWPGERTPVRETDAETS